MGSLGVEELLDIKGPELDIKPSSVLDIKLRPITLSSKSDLFDKLCFIFSFQYSFF